MRRIESTILVRQNYWCADDEFCFVSEKWDGICVNKTSSDLQSLYPGERCNATVKDWKTYDPTSECTYGPRKCDEDKKVCLGWGINEKCRLSSECNPGLYCGIDKLCVPIVEAGGICKYDVACGHENFCHYSNFTQNEGKCTPWMSIQIGDQVTFKTPLGIRYAWSDYNAHRKCESYYVNSTGHCDKGFKVSNKASECSKDDDCATS